jgi:hypothetical protein
VSFIALGSQRFDGAQAGQRGAYDDDLVERRASALQGDGLCGTVEDRVFQGGPQVLRRILVEDIEVIVVTYLEHLGHDTHAYGVALTPVEVDDHLHGNLPSVSETPTLAAVSATHRYGEAGSGASAWSRP